MCECEVILLQNATQSRLLEVFYSSRSPCSLPNRRLSKAYSSRWWELQTPGLEAKGPAGTALVALAKRFCSVLCCLIFNWVLHLGTLRLQLLRPQLRGCSVRQASMERNKLCPSFVDKLLFLREAHLLGVCHLSWK